MSEIEKRDPSALRPLDPADESDWVVAVLAGASRKGVWEPPEHLHVVSVLGGADLDFRQAELLEGVSEVHVVAVLGGVDVIVPPHVHVDANGIGLLGEFQHLAHRAGEPNAPVLRIRGWSLMGGVSIKVRS